VYFFKRTFFSLRTTIPGKKGITMDKGFIFLWGIALFLLSGHFSTVHSTGNIPAIRLVTMIGDTVVDSIHLTTDQQKNVKIQVQWSTTPGVWVDGTGEWKLDPQKDVIWDGPLPPLHSQTASWNLAPHSPGKFTLTVTAGILSISIPVTITKAQQTSVLNQRQTVDTSCETTTETASAPSHCGCGSGTGLAILPPIWFKWKARRGRKKRM
jgi:hypothetical protein